MTAYDVIVLGAGTMGLAAGYELARAGRRVLLLDRARPPHAVGSHHGETRLIRIAYAEGSMYVPLAQRARAGWRALERREHVARPLLQPTGVLTLLAPDSAAVARMDACIAEHQLGCERLSGDEVMRRWPAWQVLPEYVGYLDADAGVLWSERCLETLRDACARLGADARFTGACERLRLDSGRVTLRWDGEPFTAARLIIAAGVGTPALLQQWFPEWRVPLQARRKMVGWYPARAGISLASPALLPFLVDDGADGVYYGFPDFGSGCKVGRHDGGDDCTVEHADRTFSPNTGEEVSIRAFLRRRLPEIIAVPHRGIVCFYTMTPDADFVIDRHPHAPQVLLAAGFSGHGFKFAPVIGEILARMACDLPLAVDVTSFRSARFAASAN